MRYARHVTPLALLVLLCASLPLPGCAETRATKTATTATPREYATLGQFPEPDSLFDTKAPGSFSVKRLRVKAMAYTACPVGKKKKIKHAARGAWGDELTPEVRAVAVSPDLLQMGLDHGDSITIEGLPGKYKVLDVMHGRHARSIDIFYGDDDCGALQWGKRSLTISWHESN